MQLLLEAWQWFIERLTGGSMLVCAITGCVFLVGSALILVYTRLGQTRPVTTCVLLSIVAHLLLLTMASRVIFVRAIGDGQGDVASVNVVELPADETSDPVDAPEPEVQEPSPLDGPVADAEIAGEESLQPELPPALPRPDHDSELVIEREWTDSPRPASDPLPVEGLALAPQPVQPQPPQLASGQIRPEELPVPQVAPPVDVEVPRLEPPVESQPFELAANQGLPALPASDPLVVDGAGVEREAKPPFSPPAESAVAMPLADSTPPPALPLPQTEPAPSSVGEPPERSAERLAEAMRIQLRPADRPPVPLEYSLRTAPRRNEIVARNGGSADTEAAVAAALAWLARTQEADGRWDPKRTGAGQERNLLGQDRRGAGSSADCGITALALLAFLSAGHTQLDGEHRDSVARGLEYLCAHQAADGCLAGNATLYERTYCHGMAMLALGEAVAMTRDESLRESLRKAVGWTVNAQNRIDGGWRYQPGDAGDMSQFGWQVLGLRSAMLAGVDVPRETRDGMSRFLHQSTRGAARGLGSYRPGEGPSPTMTAEALVCRYLLEQTPAAATRTEATEYLLKALPEESQANYYYWYYATMAMHQSGGEVWERWNGELVPVLARMQVLEGPDAGSFRADRAWSCHGGQVFSTAMATLCLEVYYRYMPVYEASRPAERNAATADR